MIVLIAKLKILGKGILTEKSNQKGICGRKKALIIFLELGNFQNLLGNSEKKVGKIFPGLGHNKEKVPTVFLDLRKHEGKTGDA